MNLNGIFKLVFDLIYGSALSPTWLLAPLEALGWWAGWYGEQVDTTAKESQPIHNKKLPPVM